MRPLIRVSLFDRDSENDFTLLEDNGEYHVTFANRTGPYREFARMLFDDEELSPDLLTGDNLVSDLVIVAGDMNDEPGSAPLQPLLGVANLYDVLQLKFANNASNRWTYKYGSQLNQIDFLLVSKPLKDGFTDAGVERRGLFGVAGVAPFPSVTTTITAASDHAAIWAEFQV